MLLLLVPDVWLIEIVTRYCVMCQLVDLVQFLKNQHVIPSNKKFIPYLSLLHL